MTKYQKYSLFVLRIVIGWMFFYAGITKVLNPEWSSAGFLKGAKTFGAFYQMMLHPNILPFVDFMNEWGLLLIGISLLIGGFVRYSSYGGMLLMALYYFPRLQFPYPNDNAMLVDEHVIYIAVLAVLIAWDAGRVWGFDGWLEKRKEMTKKS